MVSRSADIVVIGGGVNGTNIAMHLSRMGAGKVLLLEKGHLASGASGRSGAMVREHYLHPTLVKMAMEASTIFHNFGDAVGGDARFIETGRALFFGERDENAARANVEMNRELGVNIQTLTPSELGEIVPEANLEGIALGVYEPTSGYADPVATTYAYAERAREYGAEIVTECAVTGIRVQGGRVVGVDTEHGIVEADAVIAATGPWVNQLAAPLGESLPIAPTRVQMVHLRRPPSLEGLNTNVIDYTTGAYFRVDAGYGTLVGGEDFDDLNEVVNPDAFGLNADHDTITKFWDRAKLSDSPASARRRSGAATARCTTWPRTATRFWTGRQTSKGYITRSGSAGMASSCRRWSDGWWRSSSCMGSAPTIRCMSFARADLRKATCYSPTIHTKGAGTSSRTCQARLTSQSQTCPFAASVLMRAMPALPGSLHLVQHHGREREDPSPVPDDLLSQRSRNRHDNLRLDGELAVETAHRAPCMYAGKAAGVDAVAGVVASGAAEDRVPPEREAVRDGGRGATCSAAGRYHHAQRFHGVQDIVEVALAAATERPVQSADKPVRRVLRSLKAVLDSLLVVVHRIGSGGSAGQIDQAAFMHDCRRDSRAFQRNHVLVEAAQRDA